MQTQCNEQTCDYTIVSDRVGRDIMVMEEERHRMARELHDGPLQTLTALGIQLEVCRQLSRENGNEILADELAQLRQDFRRSIADIRDLLTAWRLPALEADNLREAIERHAREYQRSTGIEVSLDMRGLSEARLEGEQKVAIFRILQEALRNASQHAEASQVRVEAAMNSSSLNMSISDNGKGFDLLRATANYPRHGLGLAGMHERAKAVNGQLDVDSCPGHGTKVTLTIPVQSLDDHTD
jgi:two-component system sensor histidine kinase DegS